MNLKNIYILIIVYYIKQKLNVFDERKKRNTIKILKIKKYVCVFITTNN